MSALIKIEKKKVEGLLGFLGRFLLLAAPLYFIIWLKLDFFALQAAVADQTAFVLQAIGYSVSVSQYLIKGDGFTLEIVEECIGWRDILAFAALVFATKKGGKIKALLLTPVIYFVNLLRLVLTFIIGVSFPRLAPFFHNVVFEIFMLAFVFSLWFFFYARPLGRDNRIKPA